MWLDRYRDKARARQNANKRRAAPRARTVQRDRKRVRLRTDSVFSAEQRAEACQRRRVQRLKIDKFKASPCLECKSSFPPECMDFDHREGVSKVRTISQMIGHPFDTILAEIAKCDLICANCHRIRTRLRRSAVAKHHLASRLKIEALKAEPCLDCKECFSPECMDFDHRDPKTKLMSISQMIGRRLDKILVEIAKCDLICANCHRMRTRCRRQGVTRKPAEISMFARARSLSSSSSSMELEPRS
jgi:hypothetical protein